MDMLRKVLSFIDKRYKILIIASLTIFFIFFGFVLKTYFETGYLFYRDISLRGGTSIEIPIKEKIDVQELISFLNSRFPNINIKIIRHPITGNVIYINIEGPENLNKTEILNSLKNFGLNVNEKEISVYSFSEKYGKAFYDQFLKLIIIATVLTSIVIYIRVKVPVATITIIFSTLFDIICTIGLLNLLGYEIADAGLAALLMIIGYAIDDNIIISTHFNRYKGKPFVERIYRASLTAITLTLTTVIAVLVLFLFVRVRIVEQIAFILLVSELFDEINTWLFNLPLYKWYSIREK